MAIRFLVASLVLTPVAVIAIACGGSSGNDGSLFNNNQPDTGPIVPPYEGGNLIPGVDANSDAAFACVPAALGSFTPTWKKPSTSAANKCNAQQTEDFYDKCMLEPLTSSDCTTFVAANKDCASCLQSDDTDAKYGPVIWHANRAYYTLNTAGCIAIEQNDDSSNSCAAAYQAIVQCEETACNACGAADYAQFPTCESAAASAGCTTYASAEGTTCGTELKDAGSPAFTCRSADTTAGAYQIIAPIFCGDGSGNGNSGDDGGGD